MLEEREFYDSLDGFLFEMNRVSTAKDYTDSCGRRCRSDNVFTLPSSLKDDFIAFISSSRMPEGITPDQLEDRNYPHSYVSVRYSKSPYSDPGTFVNYDGFLECDRKSFEISCDGWSLCTFSNSKRAFEDVYDWRGSLHKMWILKTEPIVRSGLTRYFRSSDGYSESKWIADRNVICYIK